MMTGLRPIGFFGRGSRRIALGAVVALTSGGSAWAQTAEDSLVNECYSLRRSNRAAQSLPRCEQAVAVSRSGRTLAQLALTEMALERWVEAAGHATQALADHEHPWVRQNHASIDEALATIRSHVATLQIVSPTAGAIVRVNDRDAGILPLAAPVFLRAGEAVIALRWPDGRTVSRRVRVTEGTSSTETFTLDAPTAPSVAPVAAPVVATVAAVPPVVQPPPRDPRPRAITPPTTPTSPARSSVRTALTWTAAGLGAAGLVLSLAAWRAREGVVDDYAGQCPAGASTDRALVDRCATLRTQADSDRGQWETLSSVGLVLGGALAITSAVLFATTPSRGRERSALHCGVGLLSAQCDVRF